jgi:predicted transcriptional regulator
MEIHLPPEVQKAIEGLAARNGTSPEAQAQALLADAVARAADHNLWVREKVREGKAASERGELIAHEEVVRRFEARFRA